jgi:hypothetical protein
MNAAPGSGATPSVTRARLRGTAVTDQLDSVGLDRDAAGLRWKSSAMLGIACGFRLASVAALVGLCESAWSDTAVVSSAELGMLGP